MTWLHSEGEGPLRYRIRLGESPDSPMVVLVHGRAGSDRSMLAFVRSFNEDCTLLLPEAPYSDEIGGWSWWLIQAPNIEELAYQSAEKLVSLVSGVIQHYKLAPRAFHAFGFSQGGALLSLVAQEKSLPLSSLCLLASFILRSKQAVPGVYPKTLMLHGSDDETIPLDAATVGLEHLEKLGFQIEIFTEAVGHKIGILGMKRLKAWISEQGLA